MTPWYRWYPFRYGRHLDVKHEPHETTNFVDWAWMCSLISILCTAQWESICTSSKPNHWAGRPNGEAVNSAVENLIRDIHAADLWGCFTYLGLYAKRPFRGIYSIQIRVTSKGAMLLPLVGCLNSASQSLSKPSGNRNIMENNGKTMGNRYVMMDMTSCVCCLHWCDSSQCCRKHLLVLMRKGVGILSTSKNAKFN